ncbi:MAG: hypothetical protein ACW99A_15645 [Candidatus Kariarchaeaceae archaeon]
MVNFAFVENPLVYGMWSFDVYHENPETWELMFVDDYVLENAKQGNYMNESKTTIKWVLISRHTWDNKFHFAYVNMISGVHQTDDFTNIVRPVDYPVGEWYHIDVIRKNNMFEIYINNSNVLNQPYSDEFDFDMNYVGFTADFGSQVRYDNFTISQPDPTSPTGTDEGFLTWQNIVFGVGLITIFYTWSIGKKNF